MTQPRTGFPQPRFIRYENLDQVSQDIREIYRLLQPRSMRIFKVAPIATDLVEGEAVLFDDEAAARKVYFKINGTLRSAAVT